MSYFTEDQISEFKDAFSLFDAKGNGKIAISQLGTVLRALGQNPTEAEVKKCCLQLKQSFVAMAKRQGKAPSKKIDSECLDFEIFLPILQNISKNSSTDTAEDFVECLRHFDKDGSGFINAAELRHLMTTLGEKLTVDEVEQLLCGLEDSHGNIHYEDFVKQVVNS